MANSGSFTTTGYSDPGYPDRYIFSWNLSSQSIVNNTSTITWSLVGAGGTSSGYFTTVKEKYVTVNGSTQSNSNLQNTYNGTVAFSGTTTIKHNADGSGSFSASAGGAFYYYGSYNSTGSGSWSLPTIARATTPTLSANSVTMGNSVTITLTPASSTFKHKLRFAFGGNSNATAGLSIGDGFSDSGNTTVTFTPAQVLAMLIPNANSGVCTLTCYTYDANGTQIGSATNKTLTLNVPSYTPTASIALTGSGLLGGVYCQSKSRVTVKTTASSSYGATITGVSATINGENNGKTYTSLEFVSAFLDKSGDHSVSVKITDSRGKTTTVTSSTFTVYAYSSPSITSFTLARQSDGTTVIATVKGSISSVNSKNARICKVTLNGVTNTITLSSYTINNTTAFTGVPTDSTLTATATLTDSYSNVPKQAVLPTVAVTLDFYKDGTGIAMGKVAETAHLFECAWDMKANKDMTVGGTLTVAGKTLLNYIYPVGSIYLSVNATNPGTLFGGTWVQLKDRFLLGVGDSYTNGETGGAATHTLTSNEMPTHGNHLYSGASWIGQGTANGKYLNSDANMSTFGTSGRGWTFSSNEAYPAGFTSGGGKAHNNMPPYLAVYMWKRTA